MNHFPSFLERWQSNFNPIHDGGQKGPHTSFSPVTSTNVGTSP